MSGEEKRVRDKFAARQGPYPRIVHAIASKFSPIVGAHSPGRAGGGMFSTHTFSRKSVGQQLMSLIAALALLWFFAAVPYLNYVRRAHVPGELTAAAAAGLSRRQLAAALSSGQMPRILHRAYFPSWSTWAEDTDPSQVNNGNPAQNVYLNPCGDCRKESSFSDVLGED